jgi:glycosyltransferase involved in cell wall biosynthesis
MIPEPMRIGFHNPYRGSVGGGDRYLYTMLEEAARDRDAELVVLGPERPDPARWAQVGIGVDPGELEWRPTEGTQLTARSRDLDLLVGLATDVPVESAARRSVAMVQFPFRARERPLERARAALLAAAGRRRAPRALASYQRYLCNSRFSQEWIARRLGVEAEVLAPPVDPPAHSPARERRPWIVSVGRFFRGGHEKRQDVLIEAFGDLGAAGWELHLAGTADAGAETQRWLAELRERARGLPVHFHVDAPREEVLDLYAGAALYWHAAGYGVDAKRHPERVEHFGIATAEAMAHGAVPLVVPEGGQAEIVRAGETGAHWRTVPELVAATRALIGAPEELARLSEAAARHARQYDTARFRAAVRERVLTWADPSGGG